MKLVMAPTSLLTWRMTFLLLNDTETLGHSCTASLVYSYFFWKGDRNRRERMKKIPETVSEREAW